MGVRSPFQSKPGTAPGGPRSIHAPGLLSLPAVATLAQVVAQRVVEESPSGGSAVHTGFVEVDFGAAPGDQSAEVAVTEQRGLVETSSVLAVVATKATADHTVDEHLMVPIRVGCIALVPGASTFVLQAVSEWQLTGKFNLQYWWV